MDLRPEAAEAIGVFFLVLAGGAAILTGAPGLAIALTFGFVIAVLIYALGHISGAHFNPAITIAFALTGHFPWTRVPRYVIAQLAGAIAASALLRFLFTGIASVTTQIAPSIGLAGAVAVEALASFLLAFVIIAVATDGRAAQGFAGLAIGLTVVADAVWAGPLTGGSMNPARSLGPALLSSTSTDLWLYLTVPIAGACLGMLTYELLRHGRKPARGEALGALGQVNLNQSREA